MHVYNNQSPMTKYRERPIGVGDSNSIGIFPERGKIYLRFDLKDYREGLVLDLNDMYYLPNSLCNLVSFIYQIDNDIYYDNKNEILYHCKTWKVLAQTKC